MLARQESDLWGFKVSRVRFTWNFTVRAAGPGMNNVWDVLSNRSSSGSRMRAITAKGPRRKVMACGVVGPNVGGVVHGILAFMGALQVGEAHESPARARRSRR